MRTAPSVYSYRRIGHAGSFTCRAVTQKLETQNKKEDQISIRTTPDNAESEVFSDSRRIFHDFFLEKVILYGEVAIESRYLETKHLKFSLLAWGVFHVPGRLVYIARSHLDSCAWQT